MAYNPPKLVRQVFTSSGTYTPTTNMVYCDIEVVGGGGGTGSLAQNAAVSISASGVTGVAGGAGSSGDFNTTGGSGQAPFGFYTATTGGVIYNGAAGSVFYGGDAYGAGSSYGGGGIGVASSINAAAGGGNAGFKGIVIITEYITA